VAQSSVFVRDLPGVHSGNGMAQHPKVHWNWKERSLLVELGPIPEDALTKPLDMVVDLDEEEEPIAIEVLEFALQAGVAVHHVPQKGGDDGKFPRWSYDAQSDSFYLRLRKGRSLAQRELTGAILMTKDSQMAGLRAEW
jgi:hypothetical protein